MSKIHVVSMYVDGELRHLSVESKDKEQAQERCITYCEENNKVHGNIVNIKLHVPFGWDKV